MKQWVVFVCLCMSIASALGYYYWEKLHPEEIISPVGMFRPKPLAKYSIEQLSNYPFQASPITLDTAVSTTSAFTVYSFHYTVEGKNVTGLAHIPTPDTGNQSIKRYQKFPVILQFRGYVDPKNYSPGVGTKHSAEVLAQSGFISLAPDFLGYGGSDALSGNIFQDRFETYTTALQLYYSVSTVPMADASRIGIWGHSNGGQIAITAAEILQKPLPVVLWAPVTKPFPYSILYYTDDADDHGKFLRRELARFENDYDAEQYSLTNFLDRLQGTFQIHQGTADDAVPQKWTDTFVNALKVNRKDAEYFVYPGADHDMQGSWNTVVARDISFFNRYLK